MNIKGFQTQTSREKKRVLHGYADLEMLKLDLADTDAPKMHFHLLASFDVLRLNRAQ